MFTSSKSNPVLNLLRENWDSGDVFGSAMAGLIDLGDTDKAPATEETTAEGLHSGQHLMLSELRVQAGWQVVGGLDEADPYSFPEWNYEPEQTPAEDELEQHEIMASRILDRMIDVARASGLGY